MKTSEAPENDIELGCVLIEWYESRTGREPGICLITAMVDMARRNVPLMIFFNPELRPHPEFKTDDITTLLK